MSKISLTNALALILDNLTLAASIIECTEEAAKELSPVSRQGLAKVHTGLAMAIQGMEYEELQALIMQNQAKGDSIIT